MLEFLDSLIATSHCASDSLASTCGVSMGPFTTLAGIVMCVLVYGVCVWPLVRVLRFLAGGRVDVVKEG